MRDAGGAPAAATRPRALLAPHLDPRRAGRAIARAYVELERDRTEPLRVAGADLSHVGPRFGDPPLDPRAKEEIEAIDREALRAAERGDAEGWFASIAAHADSSRICGYAPVYATLRCAAPQAGRLLVYEQ